MERFKLFMFKAGSLIVTKIDDNKFNSFFRYVFRKLSIRIILRIIYDDLIDVNTHNIFHKTTICSKKGAKFLKINDHLIQNI